MPSEVQELRLKVETNAKEEFAISLGYDVTPPNVYVGAIYAGCVLIFLYMLIIFEVNHFVAK